MLDCGGPLPDLAMRETRTPSGPDLARLFGHLPGSFSGAGPKAKRGLIQQADGGTLFLDEIGDMPRDLQARLLRVLACWPSTRCCPSAPRGPRR